MEFPSDIAHLAMKARQSGEFWDRSLGATGALEATSRRNRAALDAVAFHTRVLRDVSRRTTKTRFLGHDLSLPVMIAPMNEIDLVDAGGALTVAKAAQKCGSMTFHSLFCRPSLEEMGEHANGPKVLQLYGMGDRAWCLGLVRRAERAGYDALCITVNTPVYWGAARGPQKLLRHTPSPENCAGMNQEYRDRMTWSDIDYLREHTSLPIVIKGVMTPDDALLCVEHGADAICVSNHGGRRKFDQPSTIEVLPDIVKAVGGRAEVVVDGGFLLGTDVLKGLALGAKAVLMGRAVYWALSTGGEAGVIHLFERLRGEILATMAYLGVSAVDELDPSYVTRVTPMTDWSHVFE